MPVRRLSAGQRRRHGCASDRGHVPSRRPPRSPSRHPGAGTATRRAMRARSSGVLAFSKERRCGVGGAQGGLFEPGDRHSVDEGGGLEGAPGEGGRDRRGRRRRCSGRSSGSARPATRGTTAAAPGRGRAAARAGRGRAGACRRRRRRPPSSVGARAPRGRRRCRRGGRRRGPPGRGCTVTSAMPAEAVVSVTQDDARKAGAEHSSWRSRMVRPATRSAVLSTPPGGGRRRRR